MRSLICYNGEMKGNKFMKKNKNIPLNLREQMNSRIGLICSVILLLLLVAGLRQLDYNLIEKPKEEAAKVAQKEAEAAKKAAEEPEVSTASVIAVGDNLYHGSLIESGENDSGTWNYDQIYDKVRDEIQAADVAMVDQETVFTTEHDAVSSYPSFATPTEVGDALMNAGFDVVESATNHIDDYGIDFLQETFNFWSSKYPDVPVLGIHPTQEDADTVKTLEVNGITISFLDYTYGTNNGGVGEGNEYMIDLFDKNKVSTMIQKAKASSDVLIFVAHWGKEEEPMPTEYEKEWATFLMQQGVDVVVGGHPHILQPYGRMSDDQGHNMLIFYSLGNFVSTQQTLTGLLEGMASFTIQKTVKNGETTIDILDPTVKPMVMHYNKDEGVFNPYMLEDYTEELASQHGVKDIIGDEFTLANLQAKFKEIMSMNVEPSTRTDLLDVSFDYELNMINSDGDIVDDIWSTSADEYLAQQGNSDDSDSSGDSSEDSEDSSYDDSSYDDSYDDSYYDEDY